MLLPLPVRRRDRARCPARRHRTARTPTLIVIGAGAVLFCCFGTACAVPVFFPVLSKALAIPLPHLTALFSATGALYCSLGLASEPLADRIGPRIVTATGGALLACGLIVVSCADSEGVFDLGYLLGVGAGVGFCFVPAVGAVQAACREKPAVAGGVAASGIGTGTLVVPSLAQLMIDHLGWRQALEIMSLLGACGVAAADPTRFGER